MRSAAYGEALALMPEKDAGRAALTERMAAAVYKQGEAARAQGRSTEAIGHFTRVASVAPAVARRVRPRSTTPPPPCWR